MDEDFIADPADLGDLGDQEPDQSGDAAGMLAAASAHVRRIADEVLWMADVWARAADDGAPQFQDRLLAEFGQDLRERVVGVPGGWAALVAELALRLTARSPGHTGGERTTR